MAPKALLHLFRDLTVPIFDSLPGSDH